MSTTEIHFKLQRIGGVMAWLTRWALQHCIHCVGGGGGNPAYAPVQNAESPSDSVDYAGPLIRRCTSCLCSPPHSHRLPSSYFPPSLSSSLAPLSLRHLLHLPLNSETIFCRISFTTTPRQAFPSIDRAHELASQPCPRTLRSQFNHGAYGGTPRPVVQAQYQCVIAPESHVYIISALQVRCGDGGRY